MSEYKYPWVPREYYLAVKGACSMIRATGYFNKAVSYYSRRYGVDPDELAKHIRARQSAGQKGKTPKSAGNNKGKQYKWFIVVEQSFCEGNGSFCYSYPKVLKGLTAETVVKKYDYADWSKTNRSNIAGSAWAEEYIHVAIAEFNTKEEAEKALPDWEELAESWRRR